MNAGQARLWALVLAQQDVIGVVLRRLGVHEADIADMTQECLLKAWQLITTDKLMIGADIRRPELAARTWLGFVTYWAVFNWRHTTAERKRRLEVAEDDVDLDIEDPHALGTRAEVRELVRRLVGLCTRQERAILAETAEGATHDEIGKKLGMPASSVGTKLRRMRWHLRKHRGR
jgi:RNA polymerase sigma factor (sigma-70 family)